MTKTKLPPSLRHIQHPIIEHLLTQLRDETTQTESFRKILAQIGGMLGYEAARDLELTSLSIKTPMEKFKGAALKKPITIVPILRAGLGLAAGMVDLIPGAKVGHLGIFRDERSLEPVQYYEKLPPDIAKGSVLLVDPMLATGGSIVGAVRLLKGRQCHDIRVVCLLAAPEGLAHVASAYPDLPIFCAAVDRQLNDKGYILPGLGDAGDRQFGTH